MTTAPAPAVAPTARGVADLPEVLSRDQAAWMLQISPRVLDELAKAGGVPFRQLGRRRLYSKSTLLTFIGSNSS